MELIRTAYHSAGLDLADTAYFEAHGTGTAAGDPLEAGALGQTFAKTRVDRDPLVVGSVKTNIGHLGGAAGLAGLIKGIYILERGVIPPHLWFEKANPKIPMEEWRIRVRVPKNKSAEVRITAGRLLTPVQDSNRADSMAHHWPPPSINRKCTDPNIRCATA